MEIIMDFNKHIPEIEKIINYRFKDKGLLIQSFTRASYANEKNGPRGGEYMSNEVLEFFGDSVLSTAIVSLLATKKTERYERGVRSSLTEGDFSNIRSKLSDKKNLAKSTEALGLNKYLLLGEGDKKLGIQNEPSVMEDLFESIIGAVYIDCGMNISTVIGVVQKMLDVSVYYDTKTAVMQSYKNALQEYCADKKHRLPAPVYKTLSEEGPDHRKVYERACLIGGEIFGIGRGKNTKIADTAAAEVALLRLKKESITTEAVPDDAPARLKSHSQKNKLPSPEFRDLGETESSRESDREYVIECRYNGICKKGVGKSKQDARARASQSILDELGIITKKKLDDEAKRSVKELQRAVKTKAKSKTAPKISIKKIDKKAPADTPSIPRKAKEAKQMKPRHGAAPKGTQQTKHKRQQ